MSYGLTAPDWTDPAAEAEHEPFVSGAQLSEWGLTVLPPDAPAQVHRSAVIPVALAVPMLVSGVSYLGGGLASVSDLAFLMLVVICVTLLAIELIDFGHRQGIGAILIYGGVLIWFCHDYASNWFLHDYARYEPAFPAVHVDTVAKALFYHCLFIEMMVLAFRFPVLRFADRLVVSVPEPADPRFYLVLVIAMLLFGWSAFLWSTDVLPVSLAEACLWFLPGVPQVHFTVGRTGNMNYNWGGYVAQIIQVGQVGGIVGMTYALLVARTMWGRLLGCLVWCFWMSYSFTSYRRGDIAFMALPVLGLMLLKFYAQADPSRRSRNLKWMVGTLAALSLIWITVQQQTATRSNNAELDLFRAAGNTMFSEGLNAWVIIPSQTGYAYDNWPGEGIIRPLPDSLWWLVSGPVPRALWTTKPIDTFATWYSSYISRDKRDVETGGVTGTTVATGAVGYWYFRYGPFSVVEGGLLFGWLMGVSERSLRRARGQPIKVLFAMAFATFMFRSYRDLWWHNLDPLLIGGVVLAILVRMVGARSTIDLPAAAAVAHA
jgi:hypothetical protein